MSSPPHPLIHLGMTGWIKFNNIDTAYYKPDKPEANDWPPRFWKFILHTKEDKDFQAALVDSRRFGRVRLIDCEGSEIRNVPPLNANGPDPVQHKEVVTREWLGEKIGGRKVPIKAWLLDQSMLSGVGNWVADEVLYHAKIHPEQYSDSLKETQLDQLHKSLHHICGIAVETLADSSKFPDSWLMRHRWGKGKEKTHKLPNGAKIIFLTVGGRTSAVVPSVQKKTGPVAGDVKAEIREEEEQKAIDLSGEEDGADEAKPDVTKVKGKGKQAKAMSKTTTPSKKQKVTTPAAKKENGAPTPATGTSSRKRKAGAETPSLSGSKRAKKPTPKVKAEAANPKVKLEVTQEFEGRRRSSRIRPGPGS